MSQRDTDWQWDSRERLWYRFDRRAGYEVFEDGSRRTREQQPRNIPRAQRAPPTAATHFGSPTAQSSSYGVVPTATQSVPGNATSLSVRGERREARDGRTAQTQDPLTHDFAQLTLNPNARPPLHNMTREWTADNGDQFLDVQNPHSEVQTYLQLGPANRITDPALYSQGIEATQMLMPTQGDEERLFEGYKRREQPRRFFTRGKVFRVLWSEPAGENRTTITLDAPGVTTGRFGERVHSKVRLFVVIREGQDYCSALPIMSYGGQGVAKQSVNKSEHSIVYCGRNAPEPFDDEIPRRGEAGMRADAIRVNPDDRTDTLASRSRIDYGKVYTIQHNIKVQPYGQVHPASEAALRHQFLNVWLGEAAAGTVAQPSSGSGLTGTAAPARTTQRRPSRRESRSTNQETSSSSQVPRAGTTASDTREAHARAAVQRLMRAGRTQEEAIDIVRAAARQQQRQPSDRAQSSAGGNDRDDESSHAESSDDESRVSGPSTDRGRERAAQSRSVRSGQHHQHPPRVDSRAREQQLPLRQAGASIPSSGQSGPQVPTSTGPVRVSAQPRPQQSQPQTSTSTQTAAAVRQLIDRGYTREQALQYVAASLARQRTGQQ